MTYESGGRRFIDDAMGDKSSVILSSKRIEALSDPKTLGRLHLIREGLERYAPQQAHILDGAITFLEELPVLCMGHPDKKPLEIERSILPENDWRDGLRAAREVIADSLPENIRGQLHNAASTAQLAEHSETLSDTELEKVTLCQQLDWARSWLGNPRFIPQRENAAAIQK